MALHLSRRAAASLLSLQARSSAASAPGWLRGAHTWNEFSSGAAVVVAPPENLDHDRLRESTLVSRQFLKGGAPPAAGAAQLHPSPASQLCQTMAFGYSLFFKDRYLRPDLLARSVAALASELPAAAARVRPPKGLPGLRSLGATVLDLNDAGIEFVLAESPAHKIEDLGPRTWTAGMAGRRLDAFGVPFYAEPFSVAAMYRGQEALLKIKLTRCADGHVVSATVNHVLADAGRALRLLERLGELYRSLAGGKAIGEPLRTHGALETARGFAAALEGAPATWEPEAPDHGLTARQWAAAPYRMHRHVSTLHDMHLLYLPAPALQRLKKVAAAGAGAGAGAPGHVSTMDAVQAFVATLVADLRGKNLVPTAPEEFTVNVDLLHKGQAFKDPGALARYVGNAVHILHVPGVDPGTLVPGNTDGCHGDDAATRARLEAAVGANARLIRRSVAAFRSDPRHALRALERQARMVALPEGRMAASFVVKGADMKVASTTAVTAFPFDTIDFGIGAPRYAQINYQPRFDWWTIIQAAQGYGDGGGVLCSLTLEAGLQNKLVRHPAWRLLAPDAHIIVADASMEVGRRKAEALVDEVSRLEEQQRARARGAKKRGKGGQAQGEDETRFLLEHAVHDVHARQTAQEFGHAARGVRDSVRGGLEQRAETLQAAGAMRRALSSLVKSVLE